MSAVNVMESSFSVYDVSIMMYFQSHYIDYKNFIQDILIPFSFSFNTFTYTEKGQWFGKIFKTIKFLFYIACT